jgi:ligand-binding sensor domain-containing protein/signal transduction histidine kinase
MKRWALFTFLLVVSAQAFAQPYSLRQYLVMDGLPQSQVNMVLEDANGYLWIATHGGGLARFDGRDFKVYTTRDGLLSNTIHYLKLDSRQNLWIVHPRGITRFNGNTFKKFQQPGIPSGRVRRVFEFRDSIYMINSQGMLGKIKEDSVYYWSKPVRENKIILYTQLLPSRDICLYLNDSSFLIKTKEEEFKISHTQEFWRLHNLCNVGNEVVMKTDKGFFVLDYRNKKIIAKNLDIDNPILLYDAHTDVYWTRTGDNLLKESFREGKHLIDTVLQETSITQIFPDSEGNTWFGSSGKGLFKYFVQDFNKLPIKKLETVMAVEQDAEGSFWIGSLGEGLIKMKDGKISSYNFNPRTENNITSIKGNRQGEVWVGMYGALGEYNKEQDKFKWYSREDGLPSSYINQLDCDDKGNVWYATNGGGAGYYNHQQFVNYTMDDGLNGKNITAIKYSPYYHRMFVGSDNGLNAIQEGKITSLPFPEFENTSILSISFYKKKWLLLGSGGAGVIIYDPETQRKVYIDSRHGLPSDFIYFVTADEEDRIWLGTEKGISKIRLSDSMEVEENLHYGFDNGLAGLQTNQNAFYFGKEKYFGLIDGVYHYNDLRNEGWKSFDLHMTGVEIFNGQYNSQDYADSVNGFFKIPYGLHLPSDKNHITFHFNRVDKRYPKSVRFQYILENYDKTWSLPSPASQMTYGNLPPGQYVFRVKATDNKGSWDKDALVYSFVVLTPFYQSAFFRIIIAVVLATGIVLFFYFRTQRRINRVIEVQRIRQQEQDSLRKDIARDFHDEMGNQLTRIINYISLIKLNGSINSQGRNSNGHNDTHELYNKVEESAKYLYTGTRDFIWSIDPVNDELSKLFIHIRDFGEKLFNEKEINFRAFNELKKPVHVSYGFSREANLIFKEAMTNSFNHSKAKNVSLTLKQEGSTFVMELQDDGCGFSMSTTEKVNGIKNMRTRADRIQATVRIKSTPGNGTVIRLSFTTINNKHHDTII